MVGGRRSSTPPSGPTAAWKELLADYEAPPIDDAIDAELREYVDRRKSEMPDEIV